MTAPSDTLAALLAAAAGQGHGWIAERVPHAGRMCLLDGVLQATAQGIVCRASGHGAPDHPLRQGGRLGAACGVEYAAQAMALHGALLAEARGAQRARMGLLVSLRNLVLHVARLDDVTAALRVQADCEANNGDHSLYRFALSAGGRPLLDGRAMVMLNVALPAEAAPSRAPR